MNRFQAWRAARARPATGFVSTPEPRTIGSIARGRQLMAGNYLFAGFLVEAPHTPIWDLPMPGESFEIALNSFGWLDDLAALGDGRARFAAQDWTWDWIDRFGNGTGPGWTPDLTGRRLIRLINHAVLLLRGRSPEQSRAFFTSLGQQTIFLSRRWQATTPGLQRFEALVGLIYAGLALTGMERRVVPALRALNRECESQISGQGGIPSRNPEDLLEVFTLLSWAAQALRDVERQPDPALKTALERIAPTLRALRHTDGGLARYHGGGRALDGRLDAALVSVGVKSVVPKDQLAMGFARMTAGRTSVIIDAAVPPSGPASINAHASTLAFELTSGRRPLIVNCGSGATFGETWRRAGRATPTHTTLGIEGISSSRLNPENDGGEVLLDVPAKVSMQTRRVADGTQVLLSHDGYVPSHGLSHVRNLLLSDDGRSLAGEDTLGALNEEDRNRFQAVMTEVQLKGVAFSVRFHLHPDVDPKEDMGGTAVSLALKSGEIWVFRHDGAAELTLEPSVYLEQHRLKPRATRQIVLSGRVMDFGRQIGWTLAKAQDTPQAIRDVVDEEVSITAATFD
ncbi:heparinase II/III family protein [Actibacterium sp. 188UL27-1]|uniref:heparinase II/III family protein n=1 Tax=Actibacterium sp. 188UL27-1 TaxID=2786961 RepID=UPI001958045A|nr:heparinase II/III family protein [Actibacterium sp. 188UL27-1]MBM7068510.1 heparinase II/III family protein [Actibacterium sp. 188UL27-1]